MVLMIVIPTTISARTPIGVMRRQSQAMERAVRKNISLKIRPHLVVARGSTGPVTALALSKDEQFLVTSVGNLSLRLWDLEAGREMAVLTGHKKRVRALALSQDGAALASLGGRHEIRLWNLETFREHHLITAHAEEGVSGIGLANGGEWLVTAGNDGKVRVWDTALASLVKTIPISPEPIRAVEIAPSRDTWAWCISGNRISRWDLVTGKRQFTIDTELKDLCCLAVGRNRRIVAVGGESGSVAVWDRASGRLLWRKKGHDGAIRSISVNVASGILASGGQDGAAQLWNVRTGEEIAFLGTHGGPVTYVQLNHEGTFALTASEDGLTQLWNTLSQSLLVSMISTETGWTVVDDRGRFDGTESSLDGIEWQDGDYRLRISRFTERYYEPALLAKSIREKKDPEARSGVPSVSEGIFLPPSVIIELDDASPAGRRGIKRVKIEAKGQGGGINEVRLYHNGKRVTLDRVVQEIEERTEAGLPKVVKTYQVELSPGRNILDAIALNRERLESNPASTEAEGDPGLGKGPVLHVIAIGVNEYKNPSLNLQYAQDDADSVKTFFESVKAHPYREASITCLMNQHATKAGIIQAIRELRYVPAQDTALVYLAGHGGAAGDSWYFAPYEVEELENPESLKERGISTSELEMEIQAISANRVFLLIDACHSGMAISPIQRLSGMKSLRLLAKTVGLHILAATNRSQFSLELDRLGHGVFTHSLLNALRGEADRLPPMGIVSVLEVMGHVEVQVPVLSRRYADYAQYPTAHSRGIDFGISRSSD